MASTFITGVYAAALRRSVASGTATNGELLSWDSQIANGTLTQVQVANRIAGSSEAQSVVNPVIRIYQSFFNRLPEGDGLDFWVGRARAGASFTSIASGFAGTPEFTQVYGAPSVSTIDAILASFYRNVLGREGDAGGLQFWKTRFIELGGGIEAMGSIATSFAFSAEFITASNPTIANLLTTAAFVGTLGSGPLSSNGGSGTGTTYGFTAGVDVLTGTSANDVFLADNSTGSVFAASVDRINGGLGTDTYKVISSAATAIETIAAPQLTSIEVLQLTGGKLAGTATVFDISAQIGVASLILESPAAMANGDSFTVTATAAVALTLSGLNGGSASADNSTIVLNGPQTVTLNGVGTTAGSITLDLSDKTTSLTLTTTGVASKATLTNSGASLNTLTITGDRALTLTESIPTLANVNAGLASAAVSVDTSAGSLSAAFQFLGGRGADTLTLGSGAITQLTSGAQLDGGAGTDTLVLKENAVLNSDHLSKLGTVKNFEVLGFGASGSGVDISTVTNFSNFRVMAGKLSETFTNALITSKFTVDVSSGGDTVSIANRASEPRLTTVTLENNATTSQTMTKLDVAEIILVNLASTTAINTIGGTTVLTELVNRDGVEIVLTGSVDLTLTKALQGTSSGAKVDASAFTGRLSLIGSTLNDTIAGGSGADTIQAATASKANQGDTLTGGAGADIFKLVATGTSTLATDFATLLKTSAGTTQVLRITDFVAGTDKIRLEIDNTAGTNVSGTSVTLAAPQTIANAGSLSAVWAGITAITASTAGAGLNAVVVTVSAGASAGTYLYVNDETAGINSANDMLINLTGLSGTLTGADFSLL